MSHSNTSIIWLLGQPLLLISCFSILLTEAKLNSLFGSLLSPCLFDLFFTLFTFIFKPFSFSSPLFLICCCDVLLYFSRWYAWSVSKTQRLKKAESSLDWRNSFDSCSIISSKTFCPLHASVCLKHHVDFFDKCILIVYTAFSPTWHSCIGHYNCKCLHVLQSTK